VDARICRYTAASVLALSAWVGGGQLPAAASPIDPPPATAPETMIPDAAAPLVPPPRPATVPVDPPEVTVPPVPPSPTASTLVDPPEGTVPPVPPPPPTSMPVDEVTVPPVPPPPPVSTPVDPPEAATPPLTVSQLSPPPAVAPVDPPEVTVPQVPSPPAPGEPTVAPSGGVPISSGAPAPSDAGELGASLLDSPPGDVAATLPEPSSAPPSPPATLPVDVVTVPPAPEPPPPTVSTPAEPSVPQVPSPPAPGEPPVAPSGGVPISSGAPAPSDARELGASLLDSPPGDVAAALPDPSSASGPAAGTPAPPVEPPVRPDADVIGASLLDGAFTTVIDAAPSGEPATSGGALGGVADALTNVTGTVSVPYVGTPSGPLPAANPTVGTPTQPVDPPAPPNAAVLGASLLSGALGGVADALTTVIDATPSGEPAPAPSGAAADAGLAAASPTAGALSSVAEALTNVTGTPSGGGPARPVGAASGVAVNGGATAPSDPSPFDPGDPTNALALLGMLDTGAVAVGCAGALAAGLPATPSCGQLAASGAQSRGLATVGAILVGIGSFLWLLRRRSDRGLGIDPHPDLAPVAC
jgi:hypothetical protein